MPCRQPSPSQQNSLCPQPLDPHRIRKTDITAHIEPTAEEKLLARKNNGVAEMIFNNPAMHNAVSLDMWQRLQKLLPEFAADPDLRVLVVSGAGGKSFVSGADISKLESERASADGAKANNATSAAAYDQLYAFPKPTIAKIQGAAAATPTPTHGLRHRPRE